MNNTFTDIESQVLHRIQRDIPITEDPFRDIAEELRIEEPLLRRTLHELKEGGIIRDISAILNIGRLGYDSSLIAFTVPAENVSRAAEIISSHPGVSHNYLRKHCFNIWFTLAVPGGESLEQNAEILKNLCGAEDMLILRNRKLLKIGVILDVGATGDDDNSTDSVPAGVTGTVDHAPEEGLSPEEKEAVRILQHDIPLTPRPFRDILENEKSALTEKTLVDIGNGLKRRGIIRRYSAVLRHRTTGYGINAMTAWKPDRPITDETIMAVFGSVQHISHLYLRDTYPGKWEHPLFAMIHARTEEELDEIISGLNEKSGITDYLVLHSLKEFKKERVKYFSHRFKEWKEQHD
jgi:DNA-binding Lrp family transcriptional regulator